MTQRNLWGELPSRSNVRSPRSILEDQAAVLADRTQNILGGEVTVKPYGQLGPDVKTKDFILHFYIVAHRLDDYAFELLKVYHDVLMYPAIVENVIGEGTSEALNEEEFVQAIGNILSSDAVRSVVVSLLAQSETEEDRRPW